MTAYAIIRVTIRVPGAMDQYRDRMPPLIEKYRGRLLANDRHPAAIEGASQTGSIVLIEFPDVATAKAFYADPDYLAAKKTREGKADLEVTIIEALASSH